MALEAIFFSQLSPTEMKMMEHYLLHEIALLQEKTSYNLCQIKLGHPVPYPYSNKKLCFFPPSVEFFGFHDANSQKTMLRGQEISPLSQVKWRVLCFKGIWSMLSDHREEGGK